MELIVLGSGSLVPTLKRGTAGFLVLIGGRRILIDSGSGTLYRLLRAGFTYNDIDILLFTHIHLDHVADFATFLFTCKYGIPPREKDLKVFGGSGFRSFHERLKVAYGDQIEPDRFRVMVEENVNRGFGEFSVRSGQARHIPESVAFRIESKDGKSIVFSGDTDYSPELTSFARKADVLVTECSFPDDHKVEGHLTPSVAGRIASEAQVGRLILAHIYPPAEEVDLAGQAGQVYDGRVVVAEDQMRIAI